MLLADAFQYYLVLNFAVASASIGAGAHNKSTFG